jgi:hypothetical protein
MSHHAGRRSIKTLNYQVPMTKVVRGLPVGLAKEVLSLDPLSIWILLNKIFPAELKVNLKVVSRLNWRRKELPHLTIEIRPISLLLGSKEVILLFNINLERLLVKVFLISKPVRPWLTFLTCPRWIQRVITDLTQRARNSLRIAAVMLKESPAQVKI